MQGGWKSMAVKFEFEKPSVCGKRVLTYWESKFPKIHAHPIIHPRPSFPHATEACWDLSFTFLSSSGS